MDILDLILHLDEHLKTIIAFLGPSTYLLLFAIIFAETGLVVAPFLPGDSLLFIAGTLASTDLLNVWVLYFSLLVAAILGDSLNYWLGHHFGARVFSKDNSRLFNKAHLEKTRTFYEKHGGKTIILARFIPVIRTFAPFVAGIGSMKYSTFFSYNVIGAFIWVTSLVFLGYFFGGLPFIQQNFEVAIIGIVAVSFIPVFLEFIKHRRENKKKVESTSFKEIKNTFKEEHLTK